jgi:flagellar protein FlgJ
MSDGLKILSGLSPIAMPEVRRDDPAQIKGAAEQFEALLIGQVLKSAREAGDGHGWLGSEDQAGQTMGELAEQHLSQMIASSGGFGLARLMQQGLRR